MPCLCFVRVHAAFYFIRPLANSLFNYVYIRFRFWFFFSSPADKRLLRRPIETFSMYALRNCQKDLPYTLLLILFVRFYITFCVKKKKKKKFGEYYTKTRFLSRSHTIIINRYMYNISLFSCFTSIIINVR